MANNKWLFKYVGVICMFIIILCVREVSLFDMPACLNALYFECRNLCLGF